jgi:hypothetical protein
LRERERLHQNSKLIPCECGCGERIKEIGIDGRKRRFKIHHNVKRENNPNWTGGRIIHSSGYIHVLKHEHPYADVNGYVKEHRLVVEKHLGRYLEEYEEVHHINGNKTDNRIENLELMTDSEHTTLHNMIDMSDRKCLICNSDQTYRNQLGNLCWFRHPITKEEWLCNICYQRTLRRTNPRV